VAEHDQGNALPGDLVEAAQRGRDVLFALGRIGHDQAWQAAGCRGRQAGSAHQVDPVRHAVRDVDRLVAVSGGPGHQSAEVFAA